MKRFTTQESCLDDQTVKKGISKQRRGESLYLVREATTFHVWALVPLLEPSY